MNKTIRYLEDARILSTAIKQGTRVQIESGLTEAEFKYRIIKLCPFIQDIILKNAKIKQYPTNQIPVKRSMFEQTTLATEDYRQSAEFKARYGNTKGLTVAK